MRRTTASALALALAAFMLLCGATEGAALSCLPGNYASEADGSCVACEAGTFKPFNGSRACLPCPGDGASAEEGRSCACGAGHFFKDNVPRAGAARAGRGTSSRTTCRG
ncbi:hypothetical protein T484DRAFT_2761530 [Baffinella frigidus]|nr:hypothetical protein T484DRAFT_2761530 [Cryptophyta sp. CCMP2293]